MHYETAEGPTMQPMRKGLPYTPWERLQGLALGVIASALDDPEGDDELLVGADADWFRYLCRVGLGLDDEMVLKIQIAYAGNAFGPRAFTDRRLHAIRYQSDSMRAAAETSARWQAWPVLGVSPLRR